MDTIVWTRVNTQGTQGASVPRRVNTQKSQKNKHRVTLVITRVTKHGCYGTDRSKNTVLHLCRQGLNTQVSYFMDGVNTRVLLHGQE